MAKTSRLKAAGMDLLDRVFRNQLLVDLVLDDDDRQLLTAIVSKTRSILEPQGLRGLRLQRAVHYILAALEALSADDPHDLRARSSLSLSLPDVPKDVGEEALKDFMKHNREFAAAYLLAVGKVATEDADLMPPGFDELATQCRQAPVTVRQRLTERTFAVEFPAACVEILAWLAAMGIVVPAKFGKESVQVSSLEEVSLRAMSMWEMDRLRQSWPHLFEQSRPVR